MKAFSFLVISLFNSVFNPWRYNQYKLNKWAVITIILDFIMQYFPSFLKSLKAKIKSLTCRQQANDESAMCLSWELFFLKFKTEFLTAFWGLLFHFYRVNFIQHPNSAGTTCLTISSLETNPVQRYSTLLWREKG